MTSISEHVLSVIIKELGEPTGIYPQLLFYCPNCKHHKKKLSINFETEEFNCWVCASDIVNKPTSGKGFKYLFDKTHIQIPDSIKDQLLNVRSYSSIDKIKDRFQSLLSDPVEVTNPNDQNFNPYFKKHFTPLLKIKNKQIREVFTNYLYSRKVSDFQIAKFNIGILNDDKYIGRIVIPSFNNKGIINYFIARSVIPFIEPKYINPKIEHTDIVFNELFIDYSKPIYLVEGFFDSLKIENSIPILGTSFNDHNNYLLKKLLNLKTKVIISLDRDAEIKQNNIVENVFKPYGINYGFIYNDINKDYGSMTASEVNSLISSESSETLSILKRKLNNIKIKNI